MRAYVNVFVNVHNLYVHTQSMKLVASKIIIYNFMVSKTENQF